MDARDTTSGRSFTFRRPSDRGSRDRVGRRELKAGRTSARVGPRDHLHLLACRRDRLSDRACPCSHQDSVRAGRPFPAVRRSPFLISNSARRRVLQVSDDRVVQRAADLLDPLVVVTRRMHAIRQNHDV